MDDRTAMVPRHQGRNILPCSPLFNRLLRFAHRTPQKIAVRDNHSNCERTHLELLTDVLALREVIQRSIDPAILGRIGNGQEVYVAVLAPGGYEYTIAVLAVLALGAAAVPLTTALPVEEAAYFIRKSNSAAVLTCSSAVKLGHALESVIQGSSNAHFKKILIRPSVYNSPMQPGNILTSSDRYLDDNGPSIVIFTSGTTGPPKGSVMRRAFVYDHAAAVADHYGLTENDVILHVLPVHHATGVGITFFPFLISGSCIEFRSGGFDEVWTWDRWREGAVNPARRLTFFSGVPTIYMRMRRHFERHLRKLPSTELAKYIEGARQFRACLCGTSALPRPINQFWTNLMQKRIVQRYGATEIGAVFKTRLDAADVPDGSVGELVPGVDLKLSEGDEGEVLVKSPYMFSKYLNEPEATARAHDADGYFRTGDIARREGRFYFIVGRSSIDIIKSGGYKISALDIEREVLALPYISEAIIVGVPDEEFGQRVGAIVSLLEEELMDEFRQTHGCGKHYLTIKSLRHDLRSRLAGYKMPTLLRIVKGDLPKTSTGKVSKKVLGQESFSSDYERCDEVQVWRPSAKAKL